MVLMTDVTYVFNKTMARPVISNTVSSGTTQLSPPDTAKQSTIFLHIHISPQNMGNHCKFGIIIHEIYDF